MVQCRNSKNETFLRGLISTAIIQLKWNNENKQVYIQTPGKAQY